MKGPCVCLAALGLLAVMGCVADRIGVVSELPAPISGAGLRVSSRVLHRRAVWPPSRPRRLPEGRDAPADWRPPTGISERWTHIIVHHSASRSGNAERFDAYHRNVNRWDELGYHFVIGNGTNSGDGEIEVGPRWIKQKHGAHCRTPDNHYNDHGIGICLVGDFRWRPPTPAQMESLSRLVRYLMRECDITVNNVLTHGGVTGRTVCPGPRFPLYGLRRAVSAYSTASVLP